MVRVASWCFRRAPWVLVLWLAALGALGFAAQRSGAAYRDTVALPAADSSVAADLLRGAGASGTEESVVVGSSTGPVDAGSARARVGELVGRLRDVSHVVSVAGWGTPPARVSADHRVAVLTVRFDAEAETLGQPVADELAGVVRDAGGNGLTAGVSGQLAELSAAPPDLGNAAIGLVAAAIVLLVTFGSLTCVVLPVLTASVSVGCALAAVALLSHLMTIPRISTEIAALLGLGVGVDYALFVLTRYRQGIQDGLAAEQALAAAASTSCRSVVFAGVTVCVSLLGMLTVGMAFLNGIAVAAAVSVLLTMVAAVTLFPALLRLLGKRMKVRPATTGGFWSRLAHSVTARPAPYAAAAVLVIAALSLPMSGLRLGVPGAHLDPPGSVTEVAANLLEDGFGSGSDGPVLLVSQLTGEGDRASVEALRAAVLPRAEVGEAAYLPSPDGPVAVLTAVPKTAPDDPATTDLLAWLRSTATAVGGPPVHLGGAVATQADFSAAIAGRLPLFLLSVVGLSVLVLAWVFRSVLIPLTAAVMNLLTAAATTGVVVWVFGQPVEPYLPVFLFAGLFGLSMDYEVFLISRMQEQWRRGSDTRAAIVSGLVATGRTITAAALIMALVFFSFAFADARVVREAGAGLAVAVLLDAALIRCVLVPAVMIRLGRANWWFPRRLRSREHHPPETAPPDDKPGEHAYADR
ncbi:MMPL family transporter [Amycolatopsis jiangsuensis]|uniref:RND superfamily putative drug exporter n=1 Tax=Amycolatopsis jiangsuensis TaxID=1181879 RepID=A0A840IPL1_9PSEU|nr:MMPL family transporter [Amycolatopsis jiangsuensis]MBB4683870.1 RND superfamily putative drug exporter [Amycolatopsis jiangsuensis]